MQIAMPVSFLPFHTFTLGPQNHTLSLPSSFFPPLFLSVCPSVPSVVLPPSMPCLLVAPTLWLPRNVSPLLDFCFLYSRYYIPLLFLLSPANSVFSAVLLSLFLLHTPSTRTRLRRLTTPASSGELPPPGTIPTGHLLSGHTGHLLSGHPGSGLSAGASPGAPRDI